jgi:hypothetical protein
MLRIIIVNLLTRPPVLVPLNQKDVSNAVLRLSRSVFNSTKVEVIPFG